MYGLAHLIELPVDFSPGAFETFLAQIDGVAKKRTTLLDLLGVAAVLEFDAPFAQEAGEVIVDFIFADWFHNFSTFFKHVTPLRHTGNYKARVGL